MTLPLWRTDDPGFRAAFERLLARLSLGEGLRAAGSADAASPAEAVRAILADVRERGDAALIEYVERFDGCRLEPDRLRVRDEEIAAAVERCPDDYLADLELAAGRIRTFQQATMVRDPEPLESDGRSLRLRYRPMDSTGIYIPGAAASLASTVLMTAVPARVARVPRIVMASPARPDGTLSDDRLAAAHIAGVTEIYRLGGAYAIAALAYGTETVPAVDFIVGPGNIYATLAKREVFGQVGIEMLPGPSEVVIVADDTAEPALVAADLLSQAEHNPGSSVLLTPSAGLADAVGAAVEEQLRELGRADVTAACLRDYGAAIVCRSLEECIDLANELAPEHMEVLTGDPERVVTGVRHAPAVFVGPWTPVAVGDYVAGPSHTLPTSGTARFSSGLHANDFLKRTSIMCYGRDALRADAAPIGRLARAEGLDAHARSVERRF
jgi:histidinol dehydrogenase